MSTIDTKSNHADEMKPNMQKGTKRAATDRSDEPKRPRFLSEKCRHPRLIAFEEREAACHFQLIIIASNQIELLEMPSQLTPEMIFDKICNDGSSKMDKNTLQSLLSNGTDRSFNQDTCRLLIDLFDSNRDGMIDRNEFRPLWKYVDEWKISFKNIAREGELTIGVDRLETALREYDRLHFDDFIYLCLVLQQLTTPFRDRDFDQEGRIRQIISVFSPHRCVKMNNNNNNNLKRFQIKPKGPEEQPTFRTKTLSEVQEFDAAGTFFLRAKIASVLFSIYKACPMRSNGIPCRKKLDEEDFCVSCAHRAKKPSRNLYLRVVLRDCDDEECEQQTTAFSHVAIKFLGIASVDAFYNLSENAPDKLESILQSKIDQTVIVKLNIKEKNETATLDWIISSISEEKPVAVVFLDDEISDDEAEDGSSSSNAFFLLHTTTIHLKSQIMKKGEDDTATAAVPQGKRPNSDSVSAAHFSTESKEMKSCKKEEPMATGCRKGTKRQYPYSLMSARAQDAWSLKLDQLEEKYSRMEEELSEDSDDAIDFYEDGIDDIVEKINRFEAKVKKWSVNHGNTPVVKKPRYNANADENSNDADDDAPTSTVYLNSHNDKMIEKTN
ncbi:hypothetical protein niasHT_027200 [Heterodera trifolii]|uniref:EF-hand domain-containing protein n=1 Tax=Heterodera trifolii TaxID=157864 RepID=A0ABD2KNI0_9BILA